MSLRERQLLEWKGHQIHRFRSFVVCLLFVCLGLCLCCLFSEVASPVVCGVGLRQIREQFWERNGSKWWLHLIGLLSEVRWCLQQRSTEELQKNCYVALSLTFFSDHVWERISNWAVLKDLCRWEGLGTSGFGGRASEVCAHRPPGRISTAPAAWEIPGTFFIFFLARQRGPSKQPITGRVIDWTDEASKCFMRLQDFTCRPQKLMVWLQTCSGFGGNRTTSITLSSLPFKRLGNL